jgi:hypothetical protein
MTSCGRYARNMGYTFRIRESGEGQRGKLSMGTNETTCLAKKEATGLAPLVAGGPE